MTPQEAAIKYGTLSFRVSSNLTLTDVARLLYNDDSEQYLYILRSLNHLINWYPIAMNTVISYIDSSSASYIDAPIY